MPSYLDEPEKGKLILSGSYRYMRHPVYTFTMTVLIASPVMTANLIFIILLTGIYIFAGTYFEEQNLKKRFGADYEMYKDKVPKFIPDIFTILNRLFSRQKS